MTEDCTTTERLARAVSATVIPFPPRPAPTSDNQAGEAAKARLERALLSLDTALNEQSAAVAAWRHTLGDLGTAMRGLGTSMLRYRDSVDVLGTDIAQLGTQAAELAARADTMAAAGRASGRPSAPGRGPAPPQTPRH